MKLLLDTHALLWWWTDNPLLPAAARKRIADERNEVLVSAASAWEIATIFRLGKLPEASAAVTQFNALVAADGFSHLPISAPHALRAAAFEAEHKDPFDRVLVAQAQMEGAVLVTCDEKMNLFSVKRMWA